ncbi:hypothetical protein BCD49_27565 [Pseudofrankia sp. EUN1h]|nr:hypothetical protein BCD49_27565 [Pseudofrankia sp. EUN1h]
MGSLRQDSEIGFSAPWPGRIVRWSRNTAYWSPGRARVPKVQVTASGSVDTVDEAFRLLMCS